MKDYTNEEIDEIYKNLPDDLKRAFSSANTGKIVEKIGRENQLNIEQIGDLANETSMVMLGVTHPNEFITNLAERLEADKEKTRAIAQKINEQIFKPVRDSLRKIHNIREEGETPKNETSREDILKEIEKEHSEESVVPEIMRGSANPFEEKMKEGVLIAPVEEKHYIEEKPKVENLPEPEKPKKYQGVDPYREPV